MLVAECCVRQLAPLSAFSSLDACNATTGSDVQALLQVGTNEESLAMDQLVYMSPILAGMSAAGIVSCGGVPH